MFFGASSSLFELDPQTGAIIDDWNPGIGFFLAMTGDPDRGVLYATECCSNEIFRIDPDSGTIIDSFYVDAVNMQGLGYYNGYIYAANNNNFLVYEIDPDTGATARSFDTSFLNPGNIQGVDAFAGSIFLNRDNAGNSLWIEQFEISDLSYIGTSYTGYRAAGSAYDGLYFWIDRECQSSSGFLKLEVIGANSPTPSPTPTCSPTPTITPTPTPTGTPSPIPALTPGAAMLLVLLVSAALLPGRKRRFMTQ